VTSLLCSGHDCSNLRTTLLAVHEQKNERQETQTTRVAWRFWATAFVVCVGFAWTQVVSAQTTSTEPAVASPVGAATIAPTSTEALPPDVERIAAVTTRAIVQQFLAENPNPRKHVVDITSSGYADDETRPALRLAQVWVGPNGALLELVGLPRKGVKHSAVMRRDTLQVRPYGGRAANVRAFEGVTELRDRRGGSALVVAPGETLYLLTEPFDDYRPFSLLHVNRNAEDSVYFDRIDPRFRERYDTMFAAANTPVAMKDFLVEFAGNDPDKRAPRVFARLLNEMRAQNSFEGFYTAYLLMQDPDDGMKAARLAQSNDERMKLEHLAIVGLVDKNRLFKLELSVDPSSASGGENTDNNPFAATFNWLSGKDKVRTAHRPIRGTLSIQLQPSSPVKVKYGAYTAKFRVTAVAPTESSKAGLVLGRGGPGEARVGRDISIRLDAGQSAASQRFDLGAMRVAYYDRGIFNGYTRERLTGDIVVEARLIGVEIAK